MSYFLVVDDDPLWLVAEVPVGDGDGKVVNRFFDRFTAEFEAMRLNEEVRAQ